MPKLQGKEFAKTIQDKIAVLKKQVPSKNPIVQADSVKVLMAVEKLLTPELVNSDKLLTDVDLQPFYDLLKEQEKLQRSVASYFYSPESMGNQLCFLLTEGLVAHNGSYSKFQLLLPTAFHHEWTKVNGLGIPEVRDKKLKGFIISDDGKRVIDVRKCLEEAADRKETVLLHTDNTSLTENEMARVLGHSSFTAEYFNELKAYEREPKQKEITRLKNALKARDDVFADQIYKGSLELHNCYGDEGDKRVIEAVFAKIATKKDLVDFLLQMPNRKWIGFVTSACKHVDLCKLILDGTKNIDELLKKDMANESVILADDKESSVVLVDSPANQEKVVEVILAESADPDQKKAVEVSPVETAVEVSAAESAVQKEVVAAVSNKARLYAMQFLAATAYSIERNAESNIGVLSWIASVLPTKLTGGIYSKQPKLESNNVLMHFLSLPPNMIEQNNLLKFAEKTLTNKDTKPMIGTHTLGCLTSWVQKHSAADRQDISQDMTLDLAASRVVHH